MSDSLPRTISRTGRKLLPFLPLSSPGALVLSPVVPQDPHTSSRHHQACQASTPRNPIHTASKTKQWRLNWVAMSPASILPRHRSKGSAPHIKTLEATGLPSSAATSPGGGERTLISTTRLDCSTTPPLSSARVMAWDVWSAVRSHSNVSSILPLASSNGCVSRRRTRSVTWTMELGTGPLFAM
jgi:hypothetical protein